MSKYYLTEAYGELYNPRRADETFYENLRFVDYLMQEEIEEVMESLLWEFMDYGNTLDESYNLIESVFSDDILLEQIILGESYETRYAVEMKKMQKKAAAARREARKSAITGALKSAGKAVQSAATGTGSAAMGAMRAGKKAVAGAYERAKGLPGKAMAALKGVVRKGAAAALKAGRKTEKAGREAERTTVTTTTTSGGGRGTAPSTETTVQKSGGAKRRFVGGLLKKAGKAVASSMKGKSTGMSRGDSAVGDAVGDSSSGRPHGPFQHNTTRPQGPKAPPVQGPRRPASARSAVGDSSSGRPHGPFQHNTTRPQGPKAPPVQGPRRPASARSAVGDSFSSTSSGRSTPERKYPIEKSGQITLFDKPVPGKSAGADVKVPSGGQRKFGATRKPKGGSGKRQLPLNLRGAGYSETQRESVDFELLAQYILEDFIAEGYANNYEDALEILENLSEESILELTEMYLEG